MKIPLDITVRGMDTSEAVEARIRRRALGLERYSRRIQRCEVWVEADHGHHRKGPLYGVRIRLTAPDAEIVVDYQPKEDDVHLAIGEAFDAARRKLEDFERERPGHRRGHEQVRRRPRPEAAGPGPAPKVSGRPRTRPAARVRADPVSPDI
jgi:ribosome-associated translation inhibitor RaiA